MRTAPGGCRVAELSGKLNENDFISGEFPGGRRGKEGYKACWAGGMVVNGRISDLVARRGWGLMLSIDWICLAKEQNGAKRENSGALGVSKHSHFL